MGTKLLLTEIGRNGIRRNGRTPNRERDGEPNWNAQQKSTHSIHSLHWDFLRDDMALRQRLLHRSIDLPVVVYTWRRVYRALGSDDERSQYGWNWATTAPSADFSKSSIFVLLMWGNVLF